MRLLKQWVKNSIFPEQNSVYITRKMLSAYQKGNKVLAFYFRNKLLYKYSIHIGQTAKIGKNLKFPHPLSIVLGLGIEIGDNCTIYQNVTIGTKHSLKNNEVKYPKIGNNVTIYPGSIILGDVKIGDNAIIGASTLILKDVEPNTTYVGNPAKKI